MVVITNGTKIFNVIVDNICDGEKGHYSFILNWLCLGLKSIILPEIFIGEILPINVTPQITDPIKKPSHENRMTLLPSNKKSNYSSYILKVPPSQ